ncbi:hypothetical protein GGI20_005534 [Coemansia sp. BCRC 34301]|nr:hypothetical protein GGI20_005534 [Coemansia sp. BCRC 34301]
MVSELKNPAVNTQIASIVDKLLGFLIQARIEAPELFYDGSATPTPTNSKTSSKTDTAVNTPTSKSSSSSPSVSSKASSQSSEESNDSDSDSESSDSSSSKTNAAQAIKPFIGLVSIGAAAGAVVASFF